MFAKAQGPAGVAENYLIESIWNGKYPAGSILPAERELADVIGVTRTTLREVLQRLARDGWLTIQHGKPTKVNDIWHSCGLNILSTLVKLDQHNSEQIIDNLLSARTNVAIIYARAAVKNNPQAVAAALAGYTELAETGEAYSEFDYQLHHALAMASNNSIYALILNGFKALYDQLGSYYFSHQEARTLAKAHYQAFLACAAKSDFEQVPELLRDYGIRSGEIFHKYSDNLPELD
ncbi:fatty acid metabolism transcriptional regulator FadR [Catenovulum sp. 2E275]|uniref:fatty acid metabolism transcriptional regulator FadR n=1 Tax=Catenovulum sp. 2E275 TaxID=2980497 RepID=UPI0021CF3648|nr:fatty acid metabolism transcriptional regulator FadR [Catenovulum sp. 2E275]MCU4676419.1 fatty acid metabolism transcriptional regulator FadR [Catenovulum sp. 2E275]